MDYVKAFLVGGAICALVQILMDNTKLMPGRIMVLLVVTGSILGAIGIYQLCRLGRSRGNGSPSGLWEHLMERRIKEHGRGWIFRDF